MSEIIRVSCGDFGRVAVLSLKHSLVEHAHSDSHIICWLGGDTTSLSVDGQLLPFNSENAVAMNGWVPHGSPLLGAGESAEFLLFYLRPIWLAKHFSMNGEVPQFESASLQLTNELQELICRLAEQMPLAGDPEAYDAEAPVKTIVKMALDSAKHSQSPLIRSLRSPVISDSRIRKSLQYMQKHLAMSAGIDELALAACVSRVHLFSLFREKMRISPSVYWNTLRMETAITRLTVSDVSVRQLSLDLGFSEPGNFSRFFRNHVGVYPSQFRVTAVESHSKS